MTQEQLQKSTTVLIIRDGDPLLVETNILTENSPVFRYILEECGFEEEEMTDFSSDAVEVFVTLLRDKKMVDIEKGLFREINKMAVAFKVAWLITDCHRWIERRILAARSEEERTYVFDESYYVLKRLKKSEYMNMLVCELGGSNSITFISRYLDDFDNLEPEMLYPLLQLVGSNCHVILDTLSKSVAKNPGLSRNALLVLQSINKWCFQADWQGWSDLFNRITKLPDIKVSDLRIISKLQNMAWQQSKSDDNKEKETSRTVMYDRSKGLSLIHI